MQKRKAERKKVYQETRHPLYIGVRERNGKWVSELRKPHNKSRVWLGTFAQPHMAAIAHDVAALALRGKSTPLNFPELSATLPRLDSFTSVKDIQLAATQAVRKYCGTVKTSSPSSSSSSKGDANKESSELSVEDSITSSFWDEEEVFNMPVLMNSMAEGLIVTPPALQNGFNWVDIETSVDLTLWGE